MQDQREEVRFSGQSSIQPGAAVRLGLALPAWESFPAGDRHQLVSMIVQTARRQVEARPTSQAQVAKVAKR
jgi:hypothetical protein